MIFICSYPGCGAASAWMLVAGRCLVAVDALCRCAGITISPNLYLLNAIVRILILFAVYQICQFLHFALQQSLVR